MIAGALDGLVGKLLVGALEARIELMFQVAMRMVAIL